MTITTELTLRDWARVVAENAASKGFQLANWDNFATKCMLAVTEVQEAIDAARGAGYLQDEIADISIRLLESLDSIWRDQWSDGRVTMRHRGPARILWREPEVVFSPVIVALVGAVEAWRKGDQKDAMISIELALLHTFRIADALDLDPMQAIASKHAKNVERPPLHGKTRTDG